MSQTQPPIREEPRPRSPAGNTPLLLTLALALAGALLLALLPRFNPPSPDAPPPPVSATARAELPTSPSPLPTPTPLGPTTLAAAPQPAAQPPSPLAAAGEPGAPPVYGYEVVNVYPHDLGAFTQGLVFDGATLYEGTGLNGRSSVRRVDLQSGQVLQQVDLNAAYFGEGITVWSEEIIQLTWQSRKGFVYDKQSFELRRDFAYPTEGWGITHDGRRLIMSDGTATLYFWDPNTLAPVDSVDVYDVTGPVVRLNELEYVQGEVWANVWQTDRIARIDPVTGQVLGWIDLSGLLTAEERSRADVLNGIAYLAEEDRLFVTGKLWPKLFEIRLTPPE